MSKNDGGFAFPFGVRREELDTYGGGPPYVTERNEPGMTLRDWFAGQALVGLAAQNPGAKTSREAEAWVDGLGMIAYQIADAMLKERDR